jgi:hypothetical protein
MERPPLLVPQLSCRRHTKKTARNSADVTRRCADVPSALVGTSALARRRGQRRAPCMRRDRRRASIRRFPGAPAGGIFAAAGVWAGITASIPGVAALLEASRARTARLRRFRWGRFLAISEVFHATDRLSLIRDLVGEQRRRLRPGRHGPGSGRGVRRTLLSRVRRAPPAERRAATPSGKKGFDGSTPALQNGTHILYAYATDGSILTRYRVPS